MLGLLQGYHYNLSCEARSLAYCYQQRVRDFSLLRDYRLMLYYYSSALILKFVPWNQSWLPYPWFISCCNSKWHHQAWKQVLCFIPSIICFDALLSLPRSSLSCFVKIHSRQLLDFSSFWKKKSLPEIVVRSTSLNLAGNCRNHH